MSKQSGNERPEATSTEEVARLRSRVPWGRVCLGRRKTNKRCLPASGPHLPGPVAARSLSSTTSRPVQRFIEYSSSDRATSMCDCVCLRAGSVRLARAPSDRKRRGNIRCLFVGPTSLASRGLSRGLIDAPRSPASPCGFELSTIRPLSRHAMLVAAVPSRLFVARARDSENRERLLSLPLSIAPLERARRSGALRLRSPRSRGQILGRRCAASVCAASKGPATVVWWIVEG
jgi:hypothetical protein